MYRSPIEVFHSDIQHQIAQQQDEQIYKAVVHIGVNVDKAELIRALQYDRDQYQKGYADGERDTMDSIVHCKDCKHYMTIHCTCDGCCISDDWYCADGERRTGDA